MIPLRFTFITCSMLLLLGSGCWRSSSPITTAPVVTPSSTKPIALEDPQVQKAHLIQVFGLANGEIVKSPLDLSGKARGTWFFEASFPIVLQDGNGKQLAKAIAQADGDWMTSDFVNWHAKLVFVAPAIATGTLILKKDNPSGEPQNDDELRIPVTF